MRDKLKKRYDCEEEQLDALLAGIDIPAIEAVLKSRVEVKIIDPPVINKIDVREHPNKAQRKLYARQLKSGGMLAGIYVDGKMQSHAMLPKGIGDALKKSTIDRLATHEVFKLLDVHFVDYGRRKILATDKRAKEGKG